MLTRPRILVVEDEPDLQNLMKLHLIREGYDVIGTGSAEEALPYLNKEHFDLAVLDWMLPGISANLRRTYPYLSIIMVFKVINKSSFSILDMISIK